MTEKEETSIIRPGQNGAGQSLERVGFGTVEVQHQRETQGMALAARAQAEVQARYIMAVQRPRNLDQVRVRINQHCQRPGFAARAEYAKPVGNNKVVGPTIRFVETALQEYGNVLPDATVVYDDDTKRVIRIAVTDLERNVTYYDDAIVEKFVERRSPKQGDEVLGSRKNSYGDTVFRIRATEDDFANKCAAAVSKKTRNLGLRILPADIVDEAMSVARTTRATQDAKDPAAARRALVDAFVEIRVMPVDLDAYLGHAFDQASPAEMDDLRAAYAAVRDGDTNWAALVEFQREQRGEVQQATKAGEAAGDKFRAKVAEVKAKQAAKNAAAPKTETKAAAPAATTSKPAEMSDEDKRAIEMAEREEQNQ